MSDEKVIKEVAIPVSELENMDSNKPSKGTVKEIIEGVKQMNETVNQYAQMKSMDIRSTYHVDPKICDELMPYSLEDIGDMSVSQMIDHIRPYADDDFDIHSVVVVVPSDLVRNRAYMSMIFKHSCEDDKVSFEDTFTDEIWNEYNNNLTEFFKANYEAEMEDDVLDLKKPLTDEEYANLTEDITLISNCNTTYDNATLDSLTEDAMYAAMLLDIKRKDIEYLKADNERRSITKEATQVLKDMDSDVPGIIKRIRKPHEDRLEEISKELEVVDEGEESSSIKQVRLEVESNEIYDYLNYTFVWKRASTYDERKRIKNIFTKEHLSNYVIERFERTMKKLKFREDIWKSFISIEEKHLSEDYWAYNNLFLFIYMRWASYVNLENNYDKETVIIVTQELINLCNHYDDEITDTIKNCIATTDSLFEEDKEWFIKHNVNSPLNETCKLHRNTNSELRRNKLKNAYERINFDGWDDSLTNDELQNKLSEYVEKISQEQIDEYDAISGVNVETVKNEEGEDMVIITPQKPETSNDENLNETTETEGYADESGLASAT